VRRHPAHTNHPRSEQNVQQQLFVVTNLRTKEHIKSVLFISSKKMFMGTLSLNQENHHFIVQIGKNESSQWTQIT
jgi:hypothetical protein